MVRRYTSVSIPVTLYERLKLLVEKSGFKSVSDYVTYVLREVVAMHETQLFSSSLTEQEVEQIKAKLKALGYI